MSLGRRAQRQNLSEGIWVGLDANFLAITHDVVAAKHIRLFNSDDLENGAVNGTDTLVSGSGAHVALLGTWALVVGVEGQPAVGLLVLHHEAVARSDASVLRVRPGYLLVGCFMNGARVRAWELRCGSLAAKILLPVKIRNKISVRIYSLV